MASNPPDFRDRARQKLARPPRRTTALDPLDPKAILAEAEGLGVGNLNVRNLAQGIRQGSISPEAARSYIENVKEAQINPNSDNLDTLPPPVTEEQANTPTASFDTRSPADRKREIESMRQEFHRPPSAVARADAALLTQAASSLNVRPLPTVIGPAQRAVAATPNLPKPPAVEQERRVGRAVPMGQGHQALNKALPFNYREQERALRQSMPIDPLTGDRFEPPSRPLQAPVDARNPRTLAQGEGREQAVQKAIESLYGGGGLYAASPAQPYGPVYLPGCEFYMTFPTASKQKKVFANGIESVMVENIFDGDGLYLRSECLSIADSRTAESDFRNIIFNVANSSGLQNPEIIIDRDDMGLIGTYAGVLQRGGKNIKIFGKLILGNRSLLSLTVTEDFKKFPSTKTVYFLSSVKKQN